MDFHVDLLGALFMIWGVLMMLIGGSTLALGIAAAALASSAGRAGGGPRSGPRFYAGAGRSEWGRQ